MKSKANIKGHPLHPILISLPIGFFLGTVMFDILGMVFPGHGLPGTAYHLELAGIISGLVAALPGFIDFLYTVPPASSAKKRAGRHGLINLSMIILFSAAFIYRQQSGYSVYLLLTLEMAGVVLLSIAGWMGGTLVTNNQISVVNRYAGAGKWKEEYHDASTGRIEIGTTAELQVNQMKLLHFGSKRMVLAKTENGHTVFEDRCTHKGGSLAGGMMICGTVQCPWHGSQFDVNNGQVKAGPATKNILIYPVIEESGKLFIDIPGTNATA